MEYVRDFTTEKALQGAGLLFTLGGKDYKLRQPYDFEFDRALQVQRAEERYVRMNDEKVKQLAEQEAPYEEIAFLKSLAELEIDLLKASAELGHDIDKDDFQRRSRQIYDIIEHRTAADTLIKEFGIAARNRYLAKTLLVDEDYKALPVAVQNAIADKAGEMFDTIMRAANFLA